MYQALYRKYRPKTFDEIVGQDVIVKTLKNSLNNNIVSHAYLLAGPRGTGKTSVAKIFAKILNCHNLKDLTPCEKCISCEQANNNQNIDIIEIDAASNTGVDSIREIRNKVTLVPTNSKYKIYIIDEVHMLSEEAFNALLKTLEEPPSHIIFIFATTEPYKIPPTILSRCQRFDYKKVSDSKIVERLKFIAEKENINTTDEALYEIARLSDGGVRDAISLLDQALSYSSNQITIKDVHDINGTLMPEEIDDFITKMIECDLVGLLKLLEEYDNNGKNVIKITQEIIYRLKNCLIYASAPNFFDNNVDCQFYNKIKEYGKTKLLYTYIKSLSSLISEMKKVNDSKLLLEIELIKIIDSSFENTERLSDKKVNNENKERLDSKDEKPATKVVESTKTEPLNEETITESSYDEEKLNFLKNERINNSLCKFSQKEREKFKKKLEKLDEYIDDPRYAKTISLIKDGELKAVSDNNAMFIYQSELMAESFNLELNNIEMLFNNILKQDIKPIAINLSDWEYVKDDYNKHKDKYIYKEESVTLNDIFKINKIQKKDKLNEIDEMFDDIIEYQK